MKLYDIPNIQKIANHYVSLNENNPFESSQASGIRDIIKIMIDNDNNDYDLKTELKKLNET